MANTGAAKPRPKWQVVATVAELAIAAREAESAGWWDLAAVLWHKAAAAAETSVERYRCKMRAERCEADTEAAAA